MGTSAPSPTISRWRPHFPAYATALDKLGWYALRAACIGVLAFLLLPILVIMPLSFSDSSFLVYPIPAWSLKWYRNLFESAEWARAAKNSFIVAPAATLIATVNRVSATAKRRFHRLARVIFSSIRRLAHD